MKNFDEMTFCVRQSNEYIFIDFDCVYQDCRWHIIFSHGELRDLVQKGTVVRDIYRHVAQEGDRWVIYDVSNIFCAREVAGKATVNFCILQFPYFAQKVLLKYVDKLVHQLLTLPEEQRREGLILTLDQTRRERWCRLYGQGKGQLQERLEPVVEEHLARCLQEEQDVGGKSLEFALESLRAMARNSTHTFFETAVLQLWRDYDGFYFEAYRPNSTRIMNGGVIKHKNNDGSFTWSVHT